MINRYLELLCGKITNQNTLEAEFDGTSAAQRRCTNRKNNDTAHDQTDSPVIPRQVAIVAEAFFLE